MNTANIKKRPGSERCPSWMRAQLYRDAMKSAFSLFLLAPSPAFFSQLRSLNRTATNSSAADDSGGCYNWHGVDAAFFMGVSSEKIGKQLPMLPIHGRCHWKMEHSKACAGTRA